MVSEREKRTWHILKKQHGGDEVTAPARTPAAQDQEHLSVQGDWWQEQEVQVEVRKSAPM